jgi:flotillin
MPTFDLLTYIFFGVLFLLGFAIACAVFFRVVVPTNNVDIVQSSKRTVSYGNGEADGQTAGNTYYKWPSWIPMIGVKTTSLPVSVFDTRLDDYAGYDKGRVPFVIDIMAFFRITDSNMAAQRISHFSELQSQLQSILQGAVRTILASYDIEQILEGRAEFGQSFTKEVDEQLKSWGVQSVKCIELMDIRDADNSHVIRNIMEKKKSLIEMQSRIEVASNMKNAQVAEIEAKREVLLQEQQAEQQVGIRTAEREQEVGIAKEKSNQTVKEQAKITAEKEMEIARVKQVKQAEIEKESKIVLSNQQREQMSIAALASKEQIGLLAEAEKIRTITIAEGKLEEATKNAKGLEAEGLARAEAEKAIQLASVTAQTTLAEQIGENPSYQSYLVQVRQVEADEKIGIEQAKALHGAEIKVIANGGSISGGLSSVGELLSSKGGTQIAGLLEGLGQTAVGGALVDKLTGSSGTK